MIRSIKTSVLSSSLQFIYTDIKSVFDRAMAWIALIFYWFDSIYQWLTSGRTSWPRGEGGEVLINMFCVRGFEMHPCRLVFKNTWTEFGRSKKNDVYLTLLINHQKTCQVTKNWRNNRHAKHWISSKQNSQATKRWKISSLLMKKLDGQCNTFCY